MPDQPVHLAIALSDLGWHPAAWRDDPDATRILDPDYWVAQVQLAQEGLLDFITLEDRLALQSEGFGPQAPRTDRVRGRLDAVLLAARIAPLTEHIGILPTAVTTHTEPFHLSKAIATLDFVSTGRAGIRLTVGAGNAAEAKLVGRRALPDLTLESLDAPETVALIESLFDEAADYAEVLRRLWDSWEDDAEIRDRATGRFIDREKLHYIDFVGEHFSVKGPSIVPRPPQGQPIVSILGHAATPYRLGARSSDVIYVTPHDDDDAARVLQEVRAEEAGVDRRGAPQLVFADLVVFLDADAEAARARRARYDELAGETYHSDALIFAGTPTELADVVERWSAAGYAGLRLRPASNERDVPAISRGLVPELQRRGLFRTAYEASTLRGLLGLDRPLSRYAPKGDGDIATTDSTPNSDDLVEATR